MMLHDNNELMNIHVANGPGPVTNRISAKKQWNIKSKRKMHNITRWQLVRTRWGITVCAITRDVTLEGNTA